MQNRAAKFVTRNYIREEGSIISMTGILEPLKWESLKKRRKDNQLILLYKGLKGKARIPTGDLIPKTRRCRNQHSMAFQLPSASVDFLCPWSILMYIIVSPKPVCQSKPNCMQTFLWSIHGSLEQKIVRGIWVT